MKNYLTWVAAICIGLAGNAGAQTVKSEKGTVSFYSTAPLENIDATSQDLVSVLDASTGEIVFSVAMKSLAFKNKKMQEDFNENFMESEKYPKASYKGKINEKIDLSKDGNYKVTSTGTLTIHGVSKQRTDTTTLVVKNGKATLKGQFWVHVADYQIKIPTIVFYHIAENVKVTFETIYPAEGEQQGIGHKGK
ncbi:MAG TPA: YceI family protein [Bacteroidia bacterium]|jgi:hypothetical protein